VAMAENLQQKWQKLLNTCQTQAELHAKLQRQGVFYLQRVLKYDEWFDKSYEDVPTIEWRFIGALHEDD